VGIGTITPREKLDVNGSAYIYDDTPNTGVTNLTIRAGANQSNAPLLAIVRNDSSTAIESAVLFEIYGTQVRLGVPLLELRDSAGSKIDFGGVSNALRFGNLSTVVFGNNQVSTAGIPDVGIERNGTAWLAICSLQA
jgi:hypothetical protein